MKQDQPSSADEHMHIVHGRTGGLFTAILWGMRVMTFICAGATGVICTKALMGISDDPPLISFTACCCFSCLLIFMVVKSMIGLLNDAKEVLVASWVFIFVVVISDFMVLVMALWSMHHISPGTATRAVMVYPQCIMVNIVLQSFLELCGAPGAPQWFRLTVWLFCSSIGGFLCVSHPSLQGPHRFGLGHPTSMLGCWAVCCIFQLVLMLLAQGFAGQVEEWTRLSSELLETAFDATFVMGPGKPAFVQMTSDRLDNVFHRTMQGCALDETIIINGAEAIEAFCKSSSTSEMDASDSRSIEDVRKTGGTGRALVTCRDARGWEFDAELRTTPQLQIEKRTRKRRLCGVIIFGERRPPLDGKISSSMAAGEESPYVTRATLGGTHNPPLEALNSRAAPAEMDMPPRRTSAKSLPSIPEGEESVGQSSKLSQAESLGVQVDIMLECCAKLQSKAKAEQERTAYKAYSNIKKMFGTTIKEVTFQTQMQLLGIHQPQANPPLSMADEPLLKQQMKDPLPESDMVQVAGHTEDPENLLPAKSSSQVRLRSSAAMQQD